MLDSLEKIPVEIRKNEIEASHYVAKKIVEAITENNAQNRHTTLGLATGKTPVLLYKELIRMHKEEGVSFKNVYTFNLDEYFPIHPNHHGSYHYYINQHLLKHIDINPSNCFIPKGSIKYEDIKTHCEEYENEIAKLGGIDIQVLGIGENGHIGFNEPGSGLQTNTRLVYLDYSTRINNAFAFDNFAEVPSTAITMGINTIMKSKAIYLLAFGDHKAKIVKDVVEEKVVQEKPASFLQYHKNCTIVLDEFATNELTRFDAPWLTGGKCNWDDKLIKRAVTKLALKLQKPILFLTEKDYKENGLAELLVEAGNHYDINLKVFYQYRDTITGWPGGKKSYHGENHPERSSPYPKRAIIFSPHPDDDIISMGGTFMRLHDHGHDVHVAYQTSGNIAVTGEFALRFLDFVKGFNDIFDLDNKKASEVFNEGKKFIKKNREEGVPDPQHLREIKGLIRRCEAMATCRYVGLKPDKVHFLNLPFYETGRVKKNDIGEKDIQITIDLLEKIKPHQIFCAGDLADPHGTHKVCLDAVYQALRKCDEEKRPWLKDCKIWLYKGAWQEWDVWDIDMAIPMSPEQVLKKRHGIFIHQSQKDIVPFQGSDSREFWQRTEDRNENTANIYAALGHTKYAALEAFAEGDFRL